MNNIHSQGYRSHSEWIFLSAWEEFKSHALEWFYRLIPEPALTDNRLRYVEHLIDYHGAFKGLCAPASMNLILPDIFVEPLLAPSQPVLADSPSLSDQFFANVGRGFQSIWPFVERYNILLVLGAPGSGKTTLLEHMTLTLSERLRLYSKNSNASEQLPILLHLRDHRQIIQQNPTYTLAEAAQHSLRMSQMSDVPPSSWFSEQLKKGRCLIMLDGLDEIVHLTPVAAWIEQQIEIYRHNRIVITSRALDHDLLHGISSVVAATTLEIQPFTNEQAQQFVKRWYLACGLATSDNEWYTRMEAQIGAEALIQLISEENITALAVNPLLLSMMAMIHRHRRQARDDQHDQLSDPMQLPNSQVELYAEVCDLLLQSSGAELDLTSAQIQRVLQPLAYQMMKHKHCSIGEVEADKVLYVPLDIESRNPQVPEFLQTIAIESGLLCEKGEYSFVHRTFQEYLAAMHIQQQWLEPELTNKSYLNDPWWHEMIGLYGARFDATFIIAACLRHQPLSLSMLRLVTHCAEGLQRVEPEVLKRLEGMLEKEVEGSQTDSVRCRLASEALLSFHINRMIPVNKERYVAESLITNAQYKLFLDEQRGAHFLQAQPTDWSENGFPAGSGLKPVIGVTSADALRFCEWLSKRDKAGFRYRLPHVGEFNPLLSEIGYWTRCHTDQIYKLEHEQRLHFSLNMLQQQLYSTLIRDLSENGSRCHERVIVLMLDLDEVRDQTEALDLAGDFINDRAHQCALDSSSNSSDNFTSAKPLTAEDAHFVARFAIERLLSVLRQQPRYRLNEQYPLNTSNVTIAEGYFELYDRLKRQQKATYAQGGIRLVAHRSARYNKRGESRNGQSRDKNRYPEQIATSYATSQSVSHQPPVSYEPKHVIQKKVCLLGDTGVGKTSLMRRFVTGYFDERYLSTVGVNISRKTVECPTNTINMLLWEIEGADGFKKKHLDFLRGVSGAIIVCDLTRHKTLMTLERYAQQLSALNGETPVIFVGNKADLTSKRAISDDELNAVAKKLACSYLLTSAKTDTQVNDAFKLLADQMQQQSKTNNYRKMALA